MFPFFLTLLAKGLSLLCNDGYEEDFVGSCFDVDECTSVNVAYQHNCDDHATCNNLPGSFECICDTGYAKNAAEVCLEIDECATNTDNCGTNTDCTNTDGSWKCDCFTGYEHDVSNTENYNCNGKPARNFISFKIN